MEVSDATEDSVPSASVTISSGSRQDNVVVRTPRKSFKKKRPVRDIDEFTKSAIRRHVIDYYNRKEVPTLRKLCVSLRHTSLFSGGRTCLNKILKDVGFKYKKLNNRKVLLEKPSIALLKCRYLRKMHKVDIKKTIFLDETWLNETLKKEYGWTDESVRSNLSAPIGKGKRMIVCHAGSSNGWIKAPPLVFESKKTGDYHEEINFTVFENWFFNCLLPAIPPKSTIVMDNASYHSRIKDKPPTSSSTKAVMIKWLQEKGISYRPDLKKPELYEVVRLHKPPTPRYEIDEKAAEMGFKVIRLPPYHCQYNPIELVWADLKEYVKSNNRTFKLKDVKDLFFQAVQQFTQDKWAKCVEHVKKLIESDWENEGLNDVGVEKFIVNLLPTDFDSEDDSEYDSEENFGCAPLQ